jgi:GDP-4-dehydro-6-deoxy-D-mannose reductase
VNGTVLITGASGFAGRHLLAHLAGAHEVVGWFRSSAPPAPLRDAARWRAVDLLDRASVRAAVAEARPQRVYHCAARSHVQGSWDEPAQALAHNVLATHHLLDAIRRADLGGCRVLITGSAAVYAPADTPLDEDAAVRPDSPYALSKLAQEMLGRRAVDEDGIDVIVARAFNHTGPGQSPAFMASGFAQQIARLERQGGEPVLRVGNVDARRDLSDVRDVVRAYAALMSNGVPGEVYNVASGRAPTVRTVIDTLADLAGLHLRLEVDPARLRPLDSPVLVGDASKLRGTTGWHPTIPLEQTLADLLHYWRQQPGTTVP